MKEVNNLNEKVKRVNNIFEMEDCYLITSEKDGHENINHVA